MNPHFDPAETPDSIAQAAAEWTLRHDRGLTAEEQDEFSQWLAADLRHRAAWTEHWSGWDELDRLTGLQTSVHAEPDPDLLAPRKGHLRRFPHLSSFGYSVLAMAAAVAVGLLLWQRPWSPPPVDVAHKELGSLALIERRELADGSTVMLNRGAVLIERFTPAERRVQLDRGEARFMVTKNAKRPFVVAAAGVTVRAVGTAFNVRLDSADVEVLVTEGKVSVARIDVDGAPSPIGTNLPLIEAGEHVVISLAPDGGAPEMKKVSASEIEDLRSWEPRLLDFTNESLAAIVAEFNRHNSVHLTLNEASLGDLRLSAVFSSDNVAGFVRLMVSDFGMRAEYRDDGEIILRKASATQRP